MNRWVHPSGEQQLQSSDCVSANVWLHEEQTKKPQAFSHCGHRVKKFIGSETTAAPVLSKLIEVFAGVESEMLFLREETSRVLLN
jgi:hypothetical protein